MKYSNATQTNATPPEFEEKDVEILNHETQVWEFYTLVRGLYYLSGRHDQPGWAKRGGGGAYSPDELNEMYKAGTLRVVDKSAYMDTATDYSEQLRRRSLERVKAKARVARRRNPMGDDTVEDIALSIELGEESGRNDEIRRRLAGFRDYKIAFESDDDEAPVPVFKLVFWAGSAFAGSLPYYTSDNEHSARIAAGQIAFRSGMPVSGRSAGAFGQPLRAVGEPVFYGSIEARKASRRDLDEYVDFLRDITGFAGEITITELGQSAEREILHEIGIRDTARRSAAA